MRNLLYLCLFCLCWPLAVHAEENEQEEPESRPAPLYYKLPKSLVANLRGGPEFIRCDIQLMYYPGEDGDNEALLDTHSPALRHELLLLLIEQDGSALVTQAGKTRLRKAALRALREVMTEQVGRPVIEDLFFTSYYVR